MDGVRRKYITDSLHAADRFLKEAENLQSSGNVRQAAQQREQALGSLTFARKWEKDTQRLAVLDKRIATLVGRSTPQQQQAAPATANACAATAPPSAAAAPPTASSSATAPNFAGGAAEAAPSGDEWMVTGAAAVRFSDIAGLDGVKTMIMNSLVEPLRYPNLFEDVPPVRGMMFYGPSGTGKTQLVRAIATEMQWTFMAADASQIFSKWQGDSEKAMKGLFEAARRHKPCIVFMDEADAVLGTGNTGDDKSGSGDSKARVCKQFLVEMDGIGTDAAERGMVVIIATNYPWLLADPVKRRFQHQVEIPLPDDAGRRALVTLALRGRRHTLDEDDVEAIAAATTGFSGADMQRLASQAFVRPIQRVQTATHFALLGDGRWAPAAPDAAGAEERTWLTLSDAEIARPPLVAADWHECLQKGLVKPSNSADMVARYASYTRAAGTRYG